MREALSGPAILGILGFVLALWICAAGTAPPARAGEPEAKSHEFEVYAGADASSASWLVYSGATAAPFGGIYDNGLRLRASAGYGRYRYKADRWEQHGTHEPEIVPDKKFSAATGFSDVLAGYLHRFGPLTAKAFAGVSIVEHDIAPFDPENSVQGMNAGLKGVVELWLNIDDASWASLDMSYTTAHKIGAVHMRNGYRVVPRLSAGIESILDANAEDRQGRAGLFLRYEWNTGEVSASGGVSGDLPNSRTLEIPTAPYGAVNWLSRF